MIGAWGSGTPIIYLGYVSYWITDRLLIQSPLLNKAGFMSSYQNISVFLNFKFLFVFPILRVMGNLTQYIILVLQKMPVE